MAHSGLADAYMLLPEYSATVDRKIVSARADEHVARALELAPDIPEVMSSEAWRRLAHDFDWQGAEEAFRKALRSRPDNPNALHWLSHTLAWQGRFDEALVHARKATEVDPRSRLMTMNLVHILVDAGQYKAGLEIAEEMRRDEPDYISLRRNLWLHELRAGRTREAVETHISWVEVSGASVDAARHLGQMLIDYDENGTVGQLTPKLIQDLKLGSDNLGQVFAYLGDREGTLTALENAAAERSGSRSVFSMKINPAYDFIRDEPRFIAVLNEIGLGD